MAYMEHVALGQIYSSRRRQHPSGAGAWKAIKVAIGLSALALILSGCSTEIQRLKLEKGQLTRIEGSVSEVALAAEAESFDPGKYDVYLKLSPTVFDQVLTAFDNTDAQIDASGRPILFTLTSARMNFQTGYPTVTIIAHALDKRSGVRAEIEIDGSLIIEGDRKVPDQLFLRVVGTRIVPKLSWGILNFTKWRFARALLSLEAAKLTDRIPRVQLPLRNDFKFGGPAETKAISLPFKDGAASGNVTTPSTEIGGALTVQRVLFLKNGVHIFANVEGI